MASPGRIPIPLDSITFEFLQREELVESLKRYEYLGIFDVYLKMVIKVVEEVKEARGRKWKIGTSLRKLLAFIGQNCNRPA